jgi:hypothetical protein
MDHITDSTLRPSKTISPVIQCDGFPKVGSGLTAHCRLNSSGKFGNWVGMENV